MGDRTLRIGAEVFKFRIGKKHVVIKPPEGYLQKGDRMVVDFSTLTGEPWHVIERGQSKRTSDGMITPGKIRAYIETLWPSLRLTV